jgi:hypothetical protein
LARVGVLGLTQLTNATSTLSIPLARFFVHKILSHTALHRAALANSERVTKWETQRNKAHHIPRSFIDYHILSNV